MEAHPQPWHESVLSTRSLSYVSALGSPISPGSESRRASLFNPHSTRYKDEPGGTVVPDDIDMAGVDPSQTEDLNLVPDLPHSVVNSLLFDLPREIRDRIYTLCLTTRGDVSVPWPERQITRTIGIHTQLLRTCRLIYDEAAPVLYNQNELVFAHPSDANIFVRAIASVAHAPQITQLSLDIRSQDLRLWSPYISSSNAKRSLDADFPNLRILRIHFRSSRWLTHHSPQLNFKSFTDDGRLEELLNVIRYLFAAPPTALAEPFDRDEPDQGGILRTEHSSQHTRASAARLDNIYRRCKARYQPSNNLRQDAPVISVCCAARVPSAHFTALTTHFKSDRAASDLLTVTGAPPAVSPYRDGDRFRGSFTTTDLVHVESARDATSPNAEIETIARTAYVEANMILLAMQISCLDSPTSGPTA